jgi:hypothetical protein
MFENDCVYAGLPKSVGGRAGSANMRSIAAGAMGAHN